MTQRRGSEAGKSGEWLVDVGGRTTEMTLDQLDAAFRAGLINEQTMVWSNGMPAWLSIGELAESANDVEPEGVSAEVPPAPARADSRAGRSTLLPAKEPRHWAGASSAQFETEPALDEEVTPCGPAAAATNAAPPPRRSRPTLSLTPLPLESTAPLVRTLSEPVIPIQKPEPQTALRTWAAAGAAAFGLTLYGLSVLRLASAPSSDGELRKGQAASTESPRPMTVPVAAAIQPRAAVEPTPAQPGARSQASAPLHDQSPESAPPAVAEEKPPEQPVRAARSGKAKKKKAARYARKKRVQSKSRARRRVTASAEVN